MILDKTSEVELIGNEMYEMIEVLYPITRSITGEGVRKTLKIFQEHIDLEIHEVKTGIRVFDWVVPEEWNINDAYIMNKNKEKIVDFKKSNIHVLQYSEKVNKKKVIRR